MFSPNSPITNHNTQNIELACKSQTKKRSICSAERFQELLNQSKPRLAPNGKERAFEAWKRDRRAAMWQRKQDLAPRNAELLSLCSLSIKILTLHLDLLKIIGDFLYVPGKPFLPTESLIMLAISESIRGPYPSLESDNPYNLAVERDQDIVHAAIYKASSRLTEHGIKAQLAMIMRFGSDDQKEKVIYYLLGHAFAIKGQWLSYERYCQYYSFLLEHGTIWLKTAPNSAWQTKNKFKELFPHLTFARALSIFSLRKSSTITTQAPQCK